MRSIPYFSCVLALLLAGCSPWVGGYYFVPHPGIVNVPATQPSQPPPLAAFASIVGIRYPDDQQHLPSVIETRLRLDNTGPDVVTFDPHSLDLTAADLMRFPPPLPIELPPEVTLQPGQSVVVTADFPFPAGTAYYRVDLSSLHLRWSAKIGTRLVQMASDFQRSAYGYYAQDPYYDGPYWGPYPYAYPYPYFGGVVVVHRRW